MRIRTDILRVFLSLIVSGIFLSGCSSRPAGVLGKEDMAQLLADIYVAEGVAEIDGRKFSNDSLKRILKQSVLKRHDVTSEEFDSSLSWYGYNMERYVEVYDRTIEILEKRLAKAEENSGTSTERNDIQMSFDGDSVDVWPGIRYRKLAANMPSEYISFNLSPDRNWEKGDLYTFRSKLLSVRGAVDAVLVAEYSDGSTSYVQSKMHGDGWHDISIVMDSLKNPRNLYGYLHYSPSSGEVAYVDSITLYRSRYGNHLSQQRKLQPHFLLREKPSASVKPIPAAADTVAKSSVAKPSDASKSEKTITLPANGKVRKLQMASPNERPAKAERPGGKK